jgi:hypothetical protein
MTELPDLPLHVRPVRPAPSGGLEKAVRDGRHRRNRFVGVAAGTVVTVTVVAAALLTGPGGTLEILQPAKDSAPAVRGGFTSPTPSASQPPATQITTASSPHHPASPPSATPPAVVPTVSPPPLVSGLLPARSTPTPVPRRRHGYVEAPDDVAAPATCQQKPSGSAGPVFYGGATACSNGSSGPSQVKRGGTVTGTADICVAHGGKAVQLGYDGGQEHQVLVTNSSGEPAYRFSATVTFTQGAHSRTVDDGRCLQWTGTWDTRTTTGTLVPPGRYQVTISLLPNTVDGQRNDPNTAGSTGFSVDVT